MHGGPFADSDVQGAPHVTPKKSERTRPLGATGSLSRVPSKLRESSLASFTGPDGDVTMASMSRESSPEDGLFSPEPSVTSTSHRKPEAGTARYASPQNSQASGAPVADYLNGMQRLGTTAARCLSHCYRRRGRRDGLGNRFGRQFLMFIVGHVAARLTL
jgi:hypothetical protein